MTDVLQAALLILVLLAALVYALGLLARLFFCKHESTFVHRHTADTHCRLCGKNLGFRG